MSELIVLRVLRNAAGEPLLFDMAGEKWALSTGLRQPARCWNCDRTMQKRERAYTPITNGGNRMRRVCAKCGGELTRGVDER